MNCVDRLVQGADEITVARAKLVADQAALRARLAELDGARRRLTFTMEPQCPDPDCLCNVPAQERKALIT